MHIMKFKFDFDSIANTFITWGLILLINGVSNFIISGASGHQTSLALHQGEEIKDFDFGLFQLASTVDRFESNSSKFFVLTTFGEHILHHLFPTLDHAVLPLLKGELLEACEIFGANLKIITVTEALTEHYKFISKKKNKISI